MSVVVILIFAAVAAVALAFVCWPLWRHTTRGRAVLAASLSLFMLAVACGTYIFVGHPDLAVRALEPPRLTDVRSLITALAWRMRKAPRDARGWMLLGRGYLTLNDPSDAAAAFKRAALLAPPDARPAMMSAYAEALVSASGGVTPEAEAVFRQVLASDPHDVAARFYLGEAYAERRDTAQALSTWNGLLADSPPNAPWRPMLLDHIAMLQGSTGAAPPNVLAMVQGLADRLKAQPNDPDGWQRLVKAYAVLGETGKARAALADARKALTGQPAALAQLGDEARALKLDK